MMNKYDFAGSVGLVHDCLIEESMPGSSQIRERIITKWSTLAAGVCLFFMAALFSWQLSHGSPVMPADSLTETDDCDVTDTETESDTTAPDETDPDTSASDETTAAEPDYSEHKPEDFISRESIIAAYKRVQQRAERKYME